MKMENNQKNKVLNEEKISKRVVNTIKEIQNIYEEYKYDTDFADLIGIKKQTLSSYMTYSRKVNIKVIFLIKHFFPEVNIEYLFTGKGSCFLDEEENSETVIALKEQIEQLKKDIEERDNKIKVYKELIFEKNS